MHVLKKLNRNEPCDNFFYGIKFQVHYTNLEQMYFLKLLLALQFFLVLKYLVICVSKSLRQFFFISFLFCPDCAPYDIKSTPSLIMYLTFDNIALKYHFKEYNIQYCPNDDLSFEYLHCRL